MTTNFSPFDFQQDMRNRSRMGPAVSYRGMDGQPKVGDKFCRCDGRPARARKTG